MQCSASRVHSHRLVQPRRISVHNPSSQLSVAVAAAAQPDRCEPSPAAQHIASGHEALQAYAELQQQQQAAQQDNGSLQRLVVQAGKLPNQADQLWGDPADRDSRDVALVEPSTRSYADLDYLSVSAVCKGTWVWSPVVVTLCGCSCAVCAGAASGARPAAAMQGLLSLSTPPAAAARLQPCHLLNRPKTQVQDRAAATAL